MSSEVGSHVGLDRDSEVGVERGLEDGSKVGVEGDSEVGSENGLGCWLEVCLVVGSIVSSVVSSLNGGRNGSISQENAKLVEYLQSRRLLLKVPSSKCVAEEIFHCTVFEFRSHEARPKHCGVSKSEKTNFKKIK